MKRNYNTDDNICALATPWGTSAIAIVRISGPECFGLVNRLISGFELSTLRAGFMKRAVLADPQNHETIDDVVLVRFDNPKSYTGEDAVEIYCHGSPFSIQKILDSLIFVGCRQAEPGEFTMRAFINGKVDLTKAEAVQEIVASKSAVGHSLALHRLGGNLKNRIDDVKAILIELAAAVEIQLDYPEEDAESAPVDLSRVDEAMEQLKNLADSYSAGRIYGDGLRVALAGQTNAGKSSLFNLFLKEDRSIVSEIHGTTRDYIEAWISIKGLPVLLYDTAGLRQSEDPIEHEGINRTREIIEHAGLVLYLVDGSLGISQDDEEFIRHHGKQNNVVYVWNKTDVSHKDVPEGFVPFSAVNGTGFKELESAILASVPEGVSLKGDELVVDSGRQKKCLDRALEALLALKKAEAESMPLDILAPEIKEAMDALGELTGEIATDDILEKMFSDFCVGK